MLYRLRFIFHFLCSLLNNMFSSNYIRSIICVKNAALQCHFMCYYVNGNWLIFVFFSNKLTVVAFLKSHISVFGRYIMAAAIYLLVIISKLSSWLSYADFLEWVDDQHSPIDLRSTPGHFLYSEWSKSRATAGNIRVAHSTQKQWYYHLSSTKVCAGFL